ncbi:hypothetical protein ASD08_18465 [Streptomyces sp. Root369]|nr:hypothetical protein ASD08_18465 [Streptomyces sp. Root369]
MRIPVAAPDETLARMAQVVNVSADQLRQVGRSIAAELLDELAAPPTAASTPGAPDSNAQIEAITALLATLSPEVRQEVLRRISQPPANETGQTESQDNSRRRKAS